MRVLAGDVGGTNARLALVEVGDDRAEIVREAKYTSRDYPGLAPIVRRFCEEVGATPDRACFGIACPIVEGECHAPNLPWTINVRRLAREIAIPRTHVVNDFDAVGHGLPRLGGQDLVTLQKGDKAEHGSIALIGAGTGLGQGFLLWDGARYRVYSSEGGHADLAPRDEVETGLVAFLSRQYGHVSYERVLSGPGIANVYRFLAASGFAAEQPAVRAEMEREDPAAVVTRRALAGSDPLCVRALDRFVETFGAQAGNLALTIVATGGVYLAGGIAPRIVPKLEDGAFVAAFRNKGRLSTFLAKVPVHVIVNPKVGLLGAAALAAELP